MFSVQKRLGVELFTARPGRRRQSINRSHTGKRKFVAQFHVDLTRKTRTNSDTEKSAVRKTDHVKTSLQRQVKARISLACLLALFGSAICPMSAADDADVIFVNGNIYTVNDRQPHAEAIAVKNQRIVFVGSNEEAKKFQAASGSRRIDLAGKTVVPGFTDSHCHIFGIGEREMRLNLEATNTREDFLAKIKTRVARAGRGQWITGRGWIETF